MGGVSRYASGTVYLLYWCKSTNTGVAKFCNAFATDKHALQQAVEIEEVQAAEALRLYGASKAWKLLGTSRPPDAIYQQVLSLLALLVQKYEY
jgi:hypothetical protein